jgi:2-haloalkanoic acid dehalogenase type II
MCARDDAYGKADRELLVSSVASWRPFPDTVAALRALEGRYRLAVISNIDDDLFASTVQQLEVAFELVVTAEQARCYKPDPAIFEEALRRLAVEPRHIAHVAEGVTELRPQDGSAVRPSGFAGMGARLGCSPRHQTLKCRT